MDKLTEAHRILLDSLNPNASEDEVVKVVDDILRGYSTRSRVVRSSHIKDYIMKKRPQWKSYLRVSPLLINKYKQLQADSLKKKKNVFVTKDILDTLMDYDIDDLDTCRFFTQLTCGRRISEMYDSIFMECTTCDHECVIAMNLKKKRQQARKGYHVRLLDGVTAKQWLRVYDHIVLNSDPDIKKESITRRLNYKLGQYGLSTHKLRGIYANLLHRQVDPSTIQTGFIMDALHLESQDVAMNYSNFVLNDGDDQ